MKYGIADSCVDGQRKERKKGVKRGPYKRKAKTEDGGVGSEYNGLSDSIVCNIPLIGEGYRVHPAGE